MKPVILGPNQPLRFYRGGPAIAAFRGLQPTDGRYPEDWIGSTTPLFGRSDVGMTRLHSGHWLRDAVRSDPLGWLGPEHVGQFGDDTALLVKLLDAGERLPVHVHPDRAFTSRHLGLRYGKSEAWIVLATNSDPVVHLGFRQDVEAGTLEDWVRAQDAEAMLAAMHTIPVHAGDAVFVPSGLPHAVGAGVFLLELQEPTDLSVLLEWRGFDVDGTTHGHLGLGFDVALQAVDRRGWTDSQVAELRTQARSDARVERPLPSESEPFFRVERLRPAESLEFDPGFAILVVVAGEGELRTSMGDRYSLRRGTTLLIPYGAGKLELQGTIDALRCRPPEASQSTRRLPVSSDRIAGR